MSSDAQRVGPLANLLLSLPFLSSGFKATPFRGIFLFNLVIESATIATVKTDNNATGRALCGYYNRYKKSWQ